jgi:four helix bundle protein
MKISRFEDLDCWKDARLLAKHVYTATLGRSFRKDALLAGRIQAAASSIMAYIAEGFSRRTKQEFITFLYMAVSTAAEIQSYLYVALDQGYISKAQFNRVYEQASRTTVSVEGFIRNLHGRPPQPDEKTRVIKKRAKSKDKDEYIDESDYMDQID